MATTEALNGGEATGASDAQVNTKAVVKRLLDLAADPEYQGFIVREQGCLSGLTSYLKHDDLEVLTLATSTVRLLASGRRSHRRALSKQPGLLDSLELLRNHASTTVQENVEAAILDLQSATGTDESECNDENNSCGRNQTSKSSSEKSKHRRRRRQSSAGVDGDDAHNERKRRKKRKTRTFVISSEDLKVDDSLAARVEAQVLRVRGIISLTLDQRRGQVLICSKKKQADIIPDVLQSIQGAGCDASFLGEVGKRGFTNDEETGSGGDGYLDDEDIFHTREGVLSRFGSSTLQARLAQQRRKERERRNQQQAGTDVAKMAGQAARWGMSWFGY